MTLQKIKTAARTFLAVAGAALAMSTLAAPFPGKPVRVITASSAGSGPDAAMRVLAEKLSAKWGQPVIVDNRPGGNGFIAVSAFRQATPDGHELINLDSSHITTHPHTFSRLPYDPQKDFAPIRPILLTDFFVVVGKDSPYKSLDDIVAAAKASKGQLTYGSWFNGSPGHLGGLRLQAQQGVDMLHVPFKEMPQLYSAVATQEVQWALGSLASAGPLEKAGKVRFIGVAAPQRSPFFPDLPSSSESAVAKGYEVNAWVGLFAPKGPPKEVREKIAADIKDVMAQPDLVDRYRNLGYAPMHLTPDGFEARIATEIKAWSKIISDARIRLD